MTAAITIHFKQPELTAGCIDTLLADGWAPVLVWDNSADDGHSLQPLQQRYALDKRVLLVANASNLGFGNGMNAALAELVRCGHGAPVLLINNDARVRPGMHAALLAAQNHTPKPALIAPRIHQDGKDHGWLHYQPWLALVTRRPLPGSFAYLSGCCLLVCREDDAVPLFDPDFFMYGEDVELTWRWRKQGGELVLLDEAWLDHAGAASSGQASATYERFLVHSHWLLTDKLASGPAGRLLMRALHLPPLLARAGLRAWRYRSWTPLRALGALFQRKSCLPTSQRARRRPRVK